MSEAQAVSVHELEQAFEVFSRVSTELDTTYRDLESRVGALTTELASARSARLVELAEKERLALRLSSLVAALPGGVIIIDAQGVVRDANPEASQLLGEPLLGEVWSEVLTNASASCDRDSSAVTLRCGRRYSISQRTLDADGDQVVLITDVSLMHTLQEQLGRKKRLTAMGEMAARLAHQIRTPLSSTTLYMAQLGRDDLPAGKRQAISVKVNHRLEHMGNLLDSMLSFVRGDSQRQTIVPLNTILQSFRATVSPQIILSGSTLTVPDVDHTLAILGDADAMVGALANLTMNAMEASAGEVDIDLWVGALNEDWLQIRLRDNGPGIPEELYERIFDPFFTTRAQGTGLGLAVVASTVGSHGGHIQVRKAPGGGAEFLLDLPIASTLADKQEARG